MPTGAFTDKAKRPSVKELLSVLGTKHAAWEELADFILESYGVRGEMLFGGKNSGWAMRFKRSGKALATLYPAANALKVQVVLNPAATEAALASRVNKKIKDMIRNAHAYHDGRWLFIEVKCGRDVQDIELLLLAKSKPRRATGIVG